MLGWVVCFCVFFFKQKTAYEMRISDWSSDVCSSDLGAADRLGLLAGTALGRLLVMAAQLHLAEDAFALHLLLQGLQGLIDIVIAHQDLHVCPILSGSKENPSRGKAAAGRAF